jgi:hypothetical protein
MTIPNIVNVATIHAESVVGDLGTTLTTTLLTGEAEHVYKINVFRVTNVTDNDATVTADLEKAGTHKKIANELTVPANSSVDIIDKTNSFYLEETDLIRGGASAASTIEVCIFIRSTSRRVGGLTYG